MNNEDILKGYNDVLTLDEVKTILKIGRNKCYKLLQTNTIKSFKIGNTYRVCKQDLIAYLKNN